MKKVLLFPFILPFVFFSTIYSQVKFEEANTTKIYIKPSDREIKVRIISVASYGIILENDETVSYKVISKIVTNNSKLIDSILTFVSSASQSSSGDDFVLDMQNAFYQKPVLADDRLFQDQTLMINFLSSRAENIELIFNFSPKVAKDIFIQMSYTNGRYPDKYVYSLSAISAGFGRKFHLSTGEILLGINSGIKALAVSSKKFMSPPIGLSEAESVSYLEFLYRNQLLYNWIYFSVGSKYYFSNVSVLGKQTHFSISLGIGFIFGEM